MKKSKAGYTLLEVLVVLVIISIVSTTAVLMIGHNSNKELESYSKALVETLTLAEEEALLRATTLGLVFSNKDYGLYQAHEKPEGLEWEVFSKAKLTPDNLELSLLVNEEAIPLAEANDEAKEAESKEPSLLISTNGTITPFRLLIGRKHDKPRYEIVASRDGSIEAHPYRGSA